MHVDDNAPSDPAPGDPAVSDPLENGSEAHPFDAIQEAIDVAANGDMVVVLDGTYTGDGNRDIDFGGRAITVRSDNGADNCIIDCDAGRGFYFHSGEDENSLLDGFTITGGFPGWGSIGGGGGGGILCEGSSPTIANCKINGNHSNDRGGGVHCQNSSLTMVNCTIADNSAEDKKSAGSAIASKVPWEYGGGISCLQSDLTLINCTITGNSALDDEGGGVFCSGSNVTITNCTLADNTGRYGRAIACDSSQESSPSQVTINNSILFNGGGEIFNNDGSTILVRYSDVQGGWTGPNINADPRFAAPGAGDYRLLPGSPAVDAGDNTALPPLVATDLDGNPRFGDDPSTPDTGHGTPPIVDMGAYEYVGSLGGTIRGGKFHDLDSDGTRDDREPGLQGWTIYLDENSNGRLDDGELATTTDSGGDYTFADLPPGTYTVAELNRDIWQQTFPGPYVTRLISRALDGSPSDHDSQYATVSADGRFVAFESRASNLVPDDTNRNQDVFVYDHQTASIERVNLTWDGSQSEFSASQAQISGDGRCVAFTARASDLVPDDTNGLEDVFVYDRLAAAVERVSVASDGSQGDGLSTNPAISADGRYVAFASGATNLVPGDTNEKWDVFVYDRQTDSIQRVSLASDGTQAGGSNNAPSISGDGRYVAFTSHATNLVPADTNGCSDMFAYDRQTGTIRRISVASNGSQSDSGSDLGCSVSYDGRYVAFASGATNLVSGDTNRRKDVFVHDQQGGRTERVSISSSGAEGNSVSSSPSISADGRYVALWSGASNLVPGDTNDRWDVFVYDRITDTIECESLAVDGSPGNDFSHGPAISADGRVLVFHSDASDLVFGDTNGREDMFLRPLDEPGLLGVHTVVVENGQAVADVDFLNHKLVGPFDHFEFDAIASPQCVDVPFDVTISAVDEQGRTLAGIDGNVELVGWAGSETAPAIVVSEIRVSSPDTIELTNVSGEDVDLSHWQVLIYDRDSGTSPLPTFTIPWSTICPAGEAFLVEQEGDGPGTFPHFYTGGQISWRSEGSAGVLLLDAAGAVVDFVAASELDPSQIDDPAAMVPDYWHGAPVVSLPNDSVSYQRIGNRDLDDASDWMIGVPSIGSVNRGLTFPFVPGGNEVAVTPTTAELVYGVWSGQLTVLEAAAAMYLRADGTDAHVGRSNMFDAELPSAEIHGSKFNDLDGDGVWDNEEPGLSDWKIYLDGNGNGQWDAEESNEMTDADGQYSFADLAPGTYTVAEVPQAGWEQTLPPDGHLGTHTAVLEHGQILQSVDFGNHESESLVDRFEFGPIYNARVVDVPFDVTVTAVDAAGNTLTEFEDRVELSGIGPGHARSIGGSDYVEERNWLLDTSVEDSRVQMIFISSELSDLSPITALSLDVVEVPDGTMNDFTIRMRHTALDEYATPAWESYGWTTVYRSDERIAETGRVKFEFSRPFAYNGVDNLMIDVSFNNSQTTGSGRCIWDIWESRYHGRTIYGVSNSNHGDPLDWSGTGSPTPQLIHSLPDTGLYAGQEVAITPAVSGEFVEGVWTGQVTVHEAVDGMFLMADDGRGHHTVGNRFDVKYADRLGEIRGSGFHDLDGDGTRDPGEPGLAGWTVYVDENANRRRDPLERYTLTGAEGNYSLTNLVAGTHLVAEVVPDGWQQTFPDPQEPNIEHLAGAGRRRSFGRLSLSADNRYVAYDNNGTAVFVYDRLTGTVEHVSVAPDGSPGNWDNRSASISADGRFVAYEARSDNLVPGDTNHCLDVFVHDRQTHTVERVSVASDGSQSNDNSHGQSISADGRWVVYSSYADNLVPGDTNQHEDVFVYDRHSGMTQRVNVASDGSQADGPSIHPSISADGRLVAFYSAAANLVVGDTNDRNDVFVHDRHLGTTRRVSVASDGTQADHSSREPAISADGRFVTFISQASNLASDPGSTLYVYDLQTGTIEPLVRSYDGSMVYADAPSISADGRQVAFSSTSSAIVPEDTNNARDVFVYDRPTGQVRRVSVGLDGSQADDDSSYSPVISADGRRVVFASEATNLAPTATGIYSKLFVALAVDSTSLGAHVVYVAEGQTVEDVNFGNRRQTLVVDRHVFYNDSAFDGSHPAANAADDNAIATDKEALLPGRTATFANYTSYSHGIDGIMVDVAGLADAAGLTAADLRLHVGNDHHPSGWQVAPEPAGVTVREGAGIDGSDRVTIIWPAGAIQNGWLQVTLLATDNTGLIRPDVFYFGNAIGESGNSTTDAKVDAFDSLAARDNPRTFLDPAPISFSFDYNRDTRVNATDMLIARNNQTHFLNALKLIRVPAAKAQAVPTEAIGRLPLPGGVLEPADDGKPSSRATSSGRLQWLYQFEPTTATGRAGKRGQATQAAVDEVLTAECPSAAD